MTLHMRQATLYQQELRKVCIRSDLLFAYLLTAQWAFAVLLAVVYYAHSEAMHVVVAATVGGAITVPSLILIRLRPGAWLTRHCVAITQMLWSALLVYLSDGRPEAHFHVFGSLAFLAFYRDTGVILTGTAVIVLEHLMRVQVGLAYADTPPYLSALEYAGWVVFEDFILLMGTRDARGEMWRIADRQARLEISYASTEAQVTDRTRELHESREQYRMITESANVIPFTYLVDERRFAYVGPQVSRITGYWPNEWMEANFVNGKFDPVHLLYGCRDDLNTTNEFAFAARDGHVLQLRVAADMGVENNQPCVRGLLMDMTERRQLEAELAQAQKLESVGRLASGIAHEINTPVQFVNDSVHFVRDATRDMHEMLTLYKQITEEVLAGNLPVDAAQNAQKRAEVLFIQELEQDVPQALERAVDGLGRIAVIVRSMKEFAHPDQNNMAATDLNQAIRSTLTIANNEYKYVADLHTEFGEIPMVRCYASEVNQVVLNLVVNAAHAIGDKVHGTQDRGYLSVKTTQDGSDVVIAISDTGGGIPEAIRSRIFDPFFTTKEVGRGTGQGLAIARSVVNKHGGGLTFSTEVGKGTTFFVRLPVEGPRAGAMA